MSFQQTNQHSSFKLYSLIAKTFVPQWFNYNLLIIEFCLAKPIKLLSYNTFYCPHIHVYQDFNNTQLDEILGYLRYLCSFHWTPHEMFHKWKVYVLLSPTYCSFPFFLSSFSLQQGPSQRTLRALALLSTLKMSFHWRFGLSSSSRLSCTSATTADN